MIEETTTTTATLNAAPKPAIRKERFEFVLTINDNIVCQRYFRINGFNWKSLRSMEMATCIDKCVELIHRDLVEKSNIYNWYTAPQVFQDKEEMEEMIAKGHMNRAEVPSYIVLRDEEETYVWDGENAVLSAKNINRLDYVKSEDDETNPSVLKFTFYDNEKEVISKVWNGNVYPRFVRNNIDLSNSRNKYRSEGSYSPFEVILMDVYINTMEDLVPKIIDRICDCCSNYRLEEGEKEKEYTTVVNYGDKTYNLDYHQTYYRNMRTLEAKYKKKTDEYFRSIGYKPTSNYEVSAIS